MAKAKVAPKTHDGTIARKNDTSKDGEKVGEIEQTQSFTAVFKADAHSAADYFLSDKEEVGREESDAGDEGTKVTVTYK